MSVVKFPNFRNLDKLNSDMFNYSHSETLRRTKKVLMSEIESLIENPLTAQFYLTEHLGMYLKAVKCGNVKSMLNFLEFWNGLDLNFRNEIISSNSNFVSSSRNFTSLKYFEDMSYLDVLNSSNRLTEDSLKTFEENYTLISINYINEELENGSKNFISPIISNFRGISLENNLIHLRIKTSLDSVFPKSFLFYNSNFSNSKEHSEGQYYDINSFLNGVSTDLDNILGGTQLNICISLKGKQRFDDFPSDIDEQILRAA